MVKIPVGTVDRVTVLVGSGLVIYGVSMLSHAAAVILAGLFLLAGALWRHPWAV